MRKIYRLLHFTLLLAAPFSCSREEAQTDSPKGKSITIQAIEKEGFTKNGITPSTEAAISEVTYVFLGQTGDSFLRYGSSAPLQVILEDDGSWDIFAFANCSGLLPDEDELTASCSAGNTILGNLSSVRNHIPMYGHMRVDTDALGGNITVPVKRLMSRIQFRFDQSGCSANSYMVKGISFRQCCGNVNMKAGDQSPLGCGFDFTPSSFSESSVNAGAVQTFYIPENLSGTCSAVTSPWDKTKPFLAAQAGGSTIADNATYMEIETLFSCPGKGLANAPVTFRFFLGGNSTTDFNIIRNTSYSVTFKVYDSSAFVKDSWKVEADLEDDVDIGVENPIEGDVIIIE